MKCIYNLPRASGKTTRLMYLSEHYQVPILCCSSAMKDILIERARQYGVDMPNPMTIHDWRWNESDNNRKVIIDEPFHVLSDLLNAEIVATAFSDDKNSELMRVFDSPSYRDVKPE